MLLGALVFIRMPYLLGALVFIRVPCLPGALVLISVDQDAMPARCSSVY